MNDLPQNNGDFDRDAFLHSVSEKLLPLYCYKDCDQPGSMLLDFPDARGVIESLKLLLDILLPARRSQGELTESGLEAFIENRMAGIWQYLQPAIEKAIVFRWMGEAGRCEGIQKDCDVDREALRVMKTFIASLPAVRQQVILDVQAAYEGDPAALSYAVVQMSYPGVLAVAVHRLAHELYKMEIPIVPRVMSEWAHTQTGADIHPGSEIGDSFFIDHATGVVIGETTHIGNRVKLYQGVTLGAKSFPLDENGRPIKHIKRHPTVEDDVVIYASAIILGGDTVIGSNTTIGGNVFLSDSVPPNSLVSNTHPDLRIKSVE